MMTGAPRLIERRRLISRTAAGAGALLLGGCDRLSHAAWFTRMLETATSVNRHAQALITPDGAVGRQYTEADLSPDFRSNGTHNPDNREYQALAAADFADWRLAVGGLVEHPARFSLPELRSLPPVTQITRHDCVEGWSCIGQWTGVPLHALLAPLGVKPNARYVMFFCYDTVGGASEPYYESIDLAEARHPGTILAYGMNSQPLPIPYGAPLRLRLGRQLGYKMAKYLKRIELVEDFGHIHGGKGGFYEDNGYAWYAGI
jgi:DMSO/TMAO reductase YedYZ molybdopterin-dependent catalytic subunit